MAKSKVSSKGTPRQEPIKHFESGVVSYSLCSDFYENLMTILYRLDFIVEAGIEGDCSIALKFVKDMTGDFRSVIKNFRGKIGQESNEAGGNDIYTISMNETLKLKVNPLERQKATGGEV